MTVHDGGRVVTIALIVGRWDGCRRLAAGPVFCLGRDAIELLFSVQRQLWVRPQLRRVG